MSSLNLDIAASVVYPELACTLTSIYCLTFLPDGHEPCWLFVFVQHVMGSTMFSQTSQWLSVALSITPVAGRVCVGTKEDRLLYSTKIPEQLVPRLWRLAQERRVPMTHLVRDAVVRYLEVEARYIETQDGGKDRGQDDQDHGTREADDPNR